MGGVNIVTPALLRSLGGALAVLLLVTACSSGADSPDADASPTPEETVEPAEIGYDLETPDGIELTEIGTELALGDSAVGAWQASQNEVAVAEIRVRRIERTSFDAAFEGWQVGPLKDAGHTPYFVRARVDNSTDADLSRVPVRLLMLDDGGNLNEPNTMGGDIEFEPCPSHELPRGFRADARAHLCFGYFLPRGRAPESMVFPSPEDQAVVSWTGDVTRWRAPEDE
jgi:hypothetical protein